MSVTTQMNKNETCLFIYLLFFVCVCVCVWVVIVIIVTLLFCILCSRLRKTRPKRTDATRGWSDCGEASARVSAAAKTTYPRVLNRTNGSRTRLPFELEPATFTSRSALSFDHLFWSSTWFYLFTILLTCACYWTVAVSGMCRGLRVAWYARVRGSAQSAQGKLRIQTNHESPTICYFLFSIYNNRILGADRSKEFYTFPAMDYESSKKTPKYEMKIHSLDDSR